jgi:hypothetical protein
MNRTETAVRSRARQLQVILRKIQAGTIADGLKAKNDQLATCCSGRSSSAEEQAAAFRQAAKAILKQAPNAQASADEPPITGHIPLPKRRPIPRP